MCIYTYIYIYIYICSLTVRRDPCRDARASALARAASWQLRRCDARAGARESGPVHVTGPSLALPPPTQRYVPLSRSLSRKMDRDSGASFGAFLQ